MNKLSDEGFQCNINGLMRQLKLFCLTACVDTIARAPMNGTMQFNGKFGCDWCYHPGKYYGTMKYPIVNLRPKDRNHEDMINDIKSAINNNINNVFVTITSIIHCAH